MTLIVYRDGVMAGDSLVTKQSGTLIVDHAKKVYKSSDGYLFGCCGATYDIQHYNDWFMHNRDKKMPPMKNISVLQISPDGVIRVFDDEFKMDSFFIHNKWYAMGLGHEFATGCLMAGASAVDTVKMATKRIPYIGGKICAVRLTNWPDCDTTLSKKQKERARGLHM